jgi:prepilin peptidase CpaA
MNLIPHSPLWLVAILALLLVFAAAEDAWRLRISNLTCVAVLICALVAMGVAGFPLGLWQNAAVFGALLVGGTLLFGMGHVGGGDVKLLAALGLWVDLKTAVWLIMAIFLAGGIVALLFIVARLTVRRRSGEKVRKSSIPYGLAIVSGAGIVFGGQLGWFGNDRLRPDPLAIPGIERPAKAP